MGAIAWKAIDCSIDRASGQGPICEIPPCKPPATLEIRSDHEYDEFLYRLNKRFLRTAGTDHVNCLRPMQKPVGIFIWTASLIRLSGNTTSATPAVISSSGSGSLVTISDDGLTIPAIWRRRRCLRSTSEQSPPWQKTVRPRKVDGVFYLLVKCRGHAENWYIWRHFADNARRLEWCSSPQTAGQTMAEARGFQER